MERAKKRSKLSDKGIINLVDNFQSVLLYYIIYNRLLSIIYYSINTIILNTHPPSLIDNKFIIYNIYYNIYIGGDDGTR